MPIATNDRIRIGTELPRRQNQSKTESVPKARTVLDANPIPIADFLSGCITEAGTTMDLNSVSETGREAVGRGYQAAKEYAGKGAEALGDVTTNLSDFVRREPWIALVAAFAVGYVAAQVVRKVST